MDSFLNDIFGSGQLSPVLLVPVLLVMVGAILVFTFGFKKPSEPQFKKIGSSSTDSSDRTRTKRKEKPTTLSAKTAANGSLATASAAQQSTKKITVPSQGAAINVTKKENKSAAPKKKEPSSSPKKPAAVATPKSTAKKSIVTPKSEKVRKPTDFDDGEWTTVPSRTDKKKKQDDLNISQALDTVLKSSSPKKSPGGGDNKKTNQKSPAAKNAKQLKDQENKSKREAAEVINKNNKNKRSDSNDDDKVVETIENIVKELKKFDSDDIVTATTAATVAIQQSEPIIVAEGNSDDDNKPVSVGAIVFDEMADVWTEAKAPKKGKKKSRKE